MENKKRRVFLLPSIKPSSSSTSFTSFGSVREIQRNTISHQRKSLRKLSLLRRLNSIRSSSGLSIEIKHPVWLEHLERTFLPYLSVVVIIYPCFGKRSYLNRWDLLVYPCFGKRSDLSRWDLLTWYMPFVDMIYLIIDMINNI